MIMYGPRINRIVRNTLCCEFTEIGKSKISFPSFYKEGIQGSIHTMVAAPEFREIPALRFHDHSPSLHLPSGPAILDRAFSVVG